MSLKNRIITKVERMLLRKFVVCEIDGLKIVEMRDKDDGYERVIHSSLELIKTYDIKRYKRVLKELSWIVNTNEDEPLCARYKRRTKGCYINFKNYDDDQTLISAYFGGIIVHEATHGLICTKEIPYTPDNRVQIERICSSEQNRFYKIIERIFPEYDGKLVREFDPSNWEHSWNMPGWKRAYLSMRRIISD